MSSLPAAAAASSGIVEHHRVDAALSVPGGYDVRAGVFRRGATQWREEALHRGLKVIMLHGQVQSRIEDRAPMRLSGSTLFLAWNTGQAQGADAFEAGVEQQYTMVSLPETSLWPELGVDPDFFQQLDPQGGTGRPVVWHGAAGREARRIADQVRACAYDGAARSLYLAAKGLELAAMALAQAGQARIEPRVPQAAARELDAAHEARRRLLADLRQVPAAAALARDLGVHTRKLDQAFKRAFGVSMARCVQEARLIRGRDLILNGGLSVSEAAWHVGYAPAHFSVAFRRHFNASPSALR
ncbi:AraC family transcriptional regulator [Achromobacter seleniivolatilans]|uniref:AraC family transcriptional regulator n=1 Tax=Achromobacter seleniivolatilans TaxID=3047478 RepID=A0ABY9LXX7_9BURK|nr:AraC family transcriptional regulator [Achromobacter sp. R39]WMD19626.1 AraC family transcriptional regulator [Achromobacter sp. R39]